MIYVLTAKEGINLHRIQFSDHMLVEPSRDTYQPTISEGSLHGKVDQAKHK